MQQMIHCNKLTNLQLTKRNCSNKARNGLEFFQIIPKLENIEMMLDSFAQINMNYQMPLRGTEKLQGYLK
jgi:hypothetical protein